MSKTRIISISHWRLNLNPTWQHIQFPDIYLLWLSGGKYLKRQLWHDVFCVEITLTVKLMKPRRVGESASCRSSMLTSRCCTPSQLSWWRQLGHTVFFCSDSRALIEQTRALLELRVRVFSWRVSVLPVHDPLRANITLCEAKWDILWVWKPYILFLMKNFWVFFKYSDAVFSPLQGFRTGCCILGLVSRL